MNRAPWLGLVLMGVGCHTQSQGIEVSVQELTNSSYTYAVYDSDNRLLHSPIEPLEGETERRKKLCLPAISDVFLVCHGWNFTVEESLHLYENYRLSLLEWIARKQQTNPGFQPFVIFVSWGSVSRPVTNGVESLLPFTPPKIVQWAADSVDKLVFHVPSNWGETTHAFRMALGPRERSKFDPQAYSCPRKDSEYQRARRRALGENRSAAYRGIDAPVAALIDELIRVKYLGGSEPRFKLHTVGHSFGAKVISLATFDATVRILMACEKLGSAALYPENQRRELVDSLVLINPAMKTTEMYHPPKVGEKNFETFRAPAFTFRAVASSIGHKAVVYSHHDAANGWVFGLSQIPLRYESLSEHSAFLPETEIPVLSALSFAARAVGSTVHSLASNVFSILTEPVDATIAVFHSEGVGDGIRNVLKIPFSPFVSQQAMGHQGFRHLGNLSGILNTNRWLTGDTRDYLNDPIRHGRDQFLTMTECQAKPLSDKAAFHEFDAGSVYDASINGTKNPFKRFFGYLRNQVTFVGAHADVRSYDEIQGLQKRERTFNFLYNFTR